MLGVLPSPGDADDFPYGKRFRLKVGNAMAGVGSLPEKPQNRRNDARSSKASANFPSERSYQTDNSSALNMAKGGHAASPLALAWIGFSNTATGSHSIRPASSSSDEPEVRDAANPSRS